MITEQPPPNYLALLNGFVQNDLIDKAQDLIKKWGLKIDIVDGKLIDNSNTVENWLNKFITVSPTLLAIKEDVRKLSPVSDEVLITGETGTGKELIARALHGEREGAFRAVNCAGIPDALLESILFGFARGAFTGAVKDTPGMFELATNGTIFLDEIGELKMELQAKLLRVIQERTITPVGALSDKKVNARVVAATNRNLLQMVDKGLFREDLYARLSTFELHIIPLRERIGDIPMIVRSLPNGLEYITEIVKNGMKFTPEYHYKYNVRSLQTAVKRWKVLGKL